MPSGIDDRVRSMAALIGTAFQRAALRFSNVVLVVGTVAAILLLPEVLTAPLILGGVLLVAGNTFLGATDEGLLTELLDDLPDAADRALGGGEAPRLSGPAGAGAGGEGKSLRGPSRELYQRILRCRKELTRELEAGGPLVAAAVATGDVEGRLEALTAAFRKLAARRDALERSRGGTTVESLTADATALRTKAASAGSDDARASFERAAVEKERTVEALGGLNRGIEQVEAKLEQIVASLESYRARMAALGARGEAMTGETAGDLERLVTGLTDEAEDLESAARLLGDQ